LLKGGGFGFAKTGGILLKLPAEFNGMGFSPHPSRLYYLWRATFPQGKADCTAGTKHIFCFPE